MPVQFPPCESPCEISHFISPKEDEIIAAKPECVYLFRPSTVFAVKDFLIFQKKICFREKIGVTVEEQPCKKGTRLLLLLFAQANLT